MNSPMLAPSLLAADFSNLGEAIKKIEEVADSFVHIDVMDGSFVPQISFGQPIIKALRPLTKRPFDVHLMIDNPHLQFKSFVEAGADYLTFHYENSIHHHRSIQEIRSLGAKPGISIVPSTPIAVLEEILPFVDLVLIMSVNPGFGGQKLIPECLNKVKNLKKARQKGNYSYIISIDGGINSDTLPPALEAGADLIVSGSSFFSGELSWPV